MSDYSPEHPLPNLPLYWKRHWLPSNIKRCLSPYSIAHHGFTHGFIVFIWKRYTSFGNFCTILELTLFSNLILCHVSIKLGKKSTQNKQIDDRQMFLLCISFQDVKFSRWEGHKSQLGIGLVHVVASGGVFRKLRSGPVTDFVVHAASRV